MPASEAAGQGILFIAYHFPPSAAIGGQRVANFATRLRALGWEPHVLTIPDKNVAQIDTGRLRDVAGLPIHKAAVWPTAIGAITAAVRLRRGSWAGTAAAAPSQPSLPPATRAAGRESLARRARRYVFSFALLPDAEKGWCVPAIVQAVRTIRRHRLTWFVTSCPPYSVHLTGLAVRKLTGARWVADFRDPWMTTGSKRLYPTSAASIGIESRIERAVIENADLVVFNVERLRNAYRDHYSHVPPDKFVYIPNGVATTERPLPDVAKYETFTISYTGSLYVGRSPAPVFRAVSRLIESGAVARDAIRVKLVGQCRFIDGEPTDRVVRKHGLDHVVEVQDSVPYAEAFDIVRKSHVALLLAPNLPYQIPGKVYDYLGAGTRILGIAEEGGTADLLKETGAGLAFAADDVDGITEFLRRELASGPHHTRRPASLARLDLQRLTLELAQHLARVSSAGKLAAC